MTARAPARIAMAGGHVIVQDNRTGRVSYWQKDYHQSAADGRGVSTADYIHAMYFFLRQVKAKYDPENLFRLNQNIPPAA